MKLTLIDDATELTKKSIRVMQNNALLGVTKHRQVWIVRCNDYLASEFHTGKNVDDYLPD